MSTLLQSLFYLWLVVSVLLVTMWFLRRQDRMRDAPEPDTLLPGFDGPVFEESPPVEGSPSSTEDEVEPEPSESDPDDGDIDPVAAEADQADTDADEETDSDDSDSDESDFDESDNSDEPEDSGAADSSDESKDSDHADNSDEPAESDDSDRPDGSADAADTVDADNDDSADEDKTADNKTDADDTAVSDDTDDSDDTADGDDTGDSDDTGDGAEKAVATTEAVRGNAGSVEHEPEEPEAPTINALLDGIDLPFDLTPIEPVDEDPDRYAVFLSPHQDPAQVGTAFADQLTELGYEIEPAGFDEAVARRNGDVLTMRIGANAGPEDDEGRRFPMASETDVAIEVWTGTGPPPKQST